MTQYLLVCIDHFSVCESARKTSHYIIYEVDKRLPYELLANAQKPVYNVDNNVDQHL